MKNSNVNHLLSRLLGSLCGAVLMLGLSGCTDDLLTGTPEWLGQSIYDEMAERGYTTSLSLINSSPVADDNYREILSRTGSKTLFVCSDEAWQRFFDKNKALDESNPWHTVTSVASFDEPGNEILVRQLFKSMMIDNAIVLDLLGKEEGAESGDADACMRRANSVNYMDMTKTLLRENYPAAKKENKTGIMDKDWWEGLRSTTTQITLVPAALSGNNNSQSTNNPTNLYAASVSSGFDEPTMVHFSPSFSTAKEFDSEDIRILSGGVATSLSQTVVNGVAVDPDESNITCQNGYIHQLAEVPYPVFNMVDKLSEEPNYSIFYKQLQRFSYPWHNVGRSNQEGYDVYTIRYFNSASNCTFTYAQDGVTTSDALLNFDPAWNRYYQYQAGGGNNYHRDCALILAPNNEVMTAFLQSEPAKALREKYCVDPDNATWDDFPDATVKSLMDECMRANFIGFQPSKVANLKNASNESIDGLATSSIKDCFVCGNGIVYGIDVVIVPPDYTNVLSTLLLDKDEDEESDEGFSVFYRFIDEDSNIPGAAAGYKAYVRSADGTKYVLFAPYDKAMRKVIDPSSIGRSNSGITQLTGPVLYDFQVKANSKVLPYADPRSYTLDEMTGRVTPGDVSSEMKALDNFKEVSSYDDWFKYNAYKMLRYIMENSICPIEGIAEGENPLRHEYTYYKTKAGSAIKVNWNGTSDDLTAATYAGGFHLRYGRGISSAKATNKSNGATIPMEEVLMPAMKYPTEILKETDEFKAFYALMDSNSDAPSTEGEGEGTASAGSTSQYLTDTDGSGHITLPSTASALSLLRPYNYTIYVPTKAAIEAKINNYELPRRAWMDAIGGTDSQITENFGSLTENELQAIKDLRDSIKTALDRYVAYHVQDNSVFVGMRGAAGTYETSLVNTETNLFYGLVVEESGSGSGKTLTVRPKGDSYNSDAYKVKVVTDGENKKFNVMATQNFYTETKKGSSSIPLGLGQVFSSSYVVLHLLDDNKDIYMPDEINPWDRDKYNDLKNFFDNHGVTLPDAL